MECPIPEYHEKARILIVEDEVLITADLESRLKGLGYNVSGKATSAEKALELVEQEQPDLVLIDIIFKGHNTLRWEPNSCHGFDAYQARLKMGLLAYKLFHLLREFYMEGEEVKQSRSGLSAGSSRLPSDFLPQQVLVGAFSLGFSIGPSLPCVLDHG